MDKVKKFFRTNGYLLGSIALAVVLITMIILIAASAGGVTNTGGNTVNVGSGAITFTKPLATTEVIKDYSDTELMYNSTLKRWEAHKAIDFKANEGELVYAVADGEVKDVYTNNLEGTVVILTHANGLESVYKSLQESTEVKKGDKVVKSQAIGKAGNTAASESSYGAHLHLEMFEEGVAVDPADYIDLGDK